MIPPGNPAPAGPSAVRPLWSLIGPALGALLAAGLLTAPIGALGGSIERALHVSAASMLATVYASYAVALAAMIVPGYLLGRRAPTATGVPALVLMIIGTLLIAFAPDTAVLAVGRVLAGLGAGAVVGVAFAVSGQLGSGRSQARLVLGIAAGVALLLGPVVSSFVTMGLDFRLAFLIDVPVALIALVVTAATGIAMLVQRTSRPRPPAAPAMALPYPATPGRPAPRTDNPPS